jgi:heme-degrading monooxygenase HmoA
MTGVIVTFNYDGDLDRARVVAVAAEARKLFEGMPGLRNKFFTVDPERQRALNFYAWDSDEAAKKFFDEALLERVTGLYGVRPTVEFVEIAEVVDNT